MGRPNGWHGATAGLTMLSPGFQSAVILRPTMRLSCDDLDEQGCADHGAPEWNSMTVVGPTKIRDARGQVSLHGSVTVHCDK